METHLLLYFIHRGFKPEYLLNLDTYTQRLFVAAMREKWNSNLRGVDWIGG